jgi:hypothetical protein
MLCAREEVETEGACENRFGIRGNATHDGTDVEEDSNVGDRLDRHYCCICLPLEVMNDRRAIAKHLLEGIEC